MKNSQRRAIIVSSLVALGAVGCSHPGFRKTAAAIDPPLEMGETWTDANQSQVDQIIGINKQLLDERTVKQKDTFYRRDAHPKHHGCVMASFKVDNSKLAAEQRVGVFGNTHSDPYQAWIRFSNGDPDGGTKADIIRDIRGMAIKLMNVDGTPSGTQDFVMLTSKEFFSKDGDDYIALHDALSSDLKKGLYFAGHLLEFENLIRGTETIGNPLQGEYYSSVPYKLGTRTMRFKARPCPGSTINDQVPHVGQATDNYLRTRLVTTLGKQAACYQLWVQPNMDMDNQPVENPMKEWDEGTSPYIPVATITIPKQVNIDSQAQVNMCENFSFNPWHTLPETRPMGQINRMRAQIYPNISNYRHANNHVTPAEPTSFNVCGDKSTAQLCSTPMR